MTREVLSAQVPEWHGLTRTGVILTGRALMKGWAITATLWLFGLFLVLAFTSQGYLFNLAVMIVLYGYGVALVVGVPLAWLLGFVLRPVRSQWLHVAAFLVVPTLVFWALGSVFGFGWSLGALGLWATVGVAGAIGRAAIWHDVVVR